MKKMMIEKDLKIQQLKLQRESTNKYDTPGVRVSLGESELDPWEMTWSWEWSLEKKMAYHRR